MALIRQMAILNEPLQESVCLLCN